MLKIKAQLFKTHKERALGLIPFEKAFPALFITRFGIYTFGMKFPIDVLILNKENKVVKISENLKPGNLFFWPPKYNKVLELPEGFIKRNKIKTGDKVDVEITGYIHARASREPY